jgi:hypothetical protein
VLLRLGAVDADETDSATISAAKRVAIGYCAHDATFRGAGLLLSRGTAEWGDSKGNSQECQSYLFGGCGHALHLGLNNTEARKKTKARKRSIKATNCRVFVFAVAFL